MNINETLSSAIFNTGRLIREKMGINCPSDFSQAEIEILRFIERNKSTQMKAVANYLHIKPSSATSLIDNLAKKRSIKRINDKADRRVVHIVLTPTGLKSLQKNYKTIHKTIASVFETLSNNDKKTLINIFNKINENTH